MELSIKTVYRKYIVYMLIKVKKHHIEYPCERLFLTHEKTPGFLASGREFNPGQEMRGGLITQSFGAIEFY